MLKEMGNQNATAVTEEEKVADEAGRNSSNENATGESETKDEQLISTAASQESADDLLPRGAGDDLEENQPLDHIKEQDRHDEDNGVNSVEPSDIRRMEDQASPIEDGDVEDQGIEDKTLDSNAGVSHESDDLATSDAKAEDHVIKKLDQDVCLQISEVNTGTARSIDEVSIQEIEEEIGHPMVAKMSETEEEKVIDQMVILEQKSKDFVEVNEEDSSSDASHNQEVLLHSETLRVASLEAYGTDDAMIEASLKSEEKKRPQWIDDHTSDQEIGGDEIEEVKAVIDTSLHVERYDHDTNNNSGSPQDSEDNATEKFYEFAGKSDDAADFKDLEIVDTKAATECNLAYETSQIERHDEETVDAKSDPEPPTEFRPPRSKTNSTDLARAETSNDHTRYVIEKSPSFEFTNLITKAGDSDQTPLLYHKKKAPIRSLSTPVIARFFAPPDGAENGNGSAEERTINTVDCDQKLPRIPLNGFIKDQNEETHLLKPQKIQQEPEIRHGMIMMEPQGSKERRAKGRVSGSYFFSSCICCARFEQLADP